MDRRTGRPGRTARRRPTQIILSTVRPAVVTRQERAARRFSASWKTDVPGRGPSAASVPGKDARPDAPRPGTRHDRGGAWSHQTAAADPPPRVAAATNILQIACRRVFTEKLYQITGRIDRREWGASPRRKLRSRPKRKSGEAAPAARRHRQVVVPSRAERLQPRRRPGPTRASGRPGGVDKHNVANGPGGEKDARVPGAFFPKPEMAEPSVEPIPAGSASAKRYAVRNVDAGENLAAPKHPGGSPNQAEPGPARLRSPTNVQNRLTDQPAASARRRPIGPDAVDHRCGQADGVIPLARRNAPRSPGGHAPPRRDPTEHPGQRPAGPVRQQQRAQDPGILCTPRDTARGKGP